MEVTTFEVGDVIETQDGRLIVTAVGSGGDIATNDKQYFSADNVKFFIKTGKWKKSTDGNVAFTLANCPSKVSRGDLISTVRNEMLVIERVDDCPSGGCVEWSKVGGREMDIDSPLLWQTKFRIGEWSYLGPPRSMEVGQVRNGKIYGSSKSDPENAAAIYDGDFTVEECIPADDRKYKDGWRWKIWTSNGNFLYHNDEWPSVFIKENADKEKPEQKTTAVAVQKPKEEKTKMTTTTDAEKKEEDFRKKWKDVSFVQEGTRIVLPTGMSETDALKWLEIKIRESQQVVKIREVIECFPLEGAYALWRALNDVYGFVSLRDTPSFFGPQPPSMIGLEVDIGRTQQVPWGRIALPNIEGHVSTGVDEKDGRFVFVLSGEVKRKDEQEISKLANIVRRYTSTESIYRGRAIESTFDSTFNITMGPRFIDTRRTNPRELVFSDEVQRQINTNLFAPILCTSACEAHKIPLKRGVLLAGPYGCGKSLTAAVLARLCEENAWTFILIKRAADLPRAIEFANQYAPAVVFCEDIDRVLDGGRDTNMDNLLNTLDGVKSKGQPVLVCLTTNNLEKIHPAFLRAGRMDSIVIVSPPDGEAVERLMLLYGRNLIARGADLSRAAMKLSGQIPATIREVVERAKLTAIWRQTQEGSLNGTLQITGEDLDTAADQMLAHVRLAAANVKPDPNPVVDFAKALGTPIAAGILTAMKELASGLDNEESLSMGTSVMHDRLAEMEGDAE